MTYFHKLYEDLQNDNQRLHEEKKLLSGENGALREDVDKWKTGYEVVSAENTELQERNISLEEDLTKWKVRLARMTDNWADEKARATNLQINLVEARKKSEDLQEQLDAIETAYPTEFTPNTTVIVEQGLTAQEVNEIVRECLYKELQPGGILDSA